MMASLLPLSESLVFETKCFDHTPLVARTHALFQEMLTHDPFKTYSILTEWSPSTPPTLEQHITCLTELVHQVLPVVMENATFNFADSCFRFENEACSLLAELTEPSIDTETYFADLPSPERGELSSPNLFNSELPSIKEESEEDLSES